MCRDLMWDLLQNTKAEIGTDKNLKTDCISVVSQRPSQIVAYSNLLENVQCPIHGWHTHILSDLNQQQRKNVVLLYLRLRQ